MTDDARLVDPAPGQGWAAWSPDAVGRTATEKGLPIRSLSAHLARRLGAIALGVGGIDPSLVPPDGRAGLDADYLIGFGDDAVPVLIAALPQLEEPERTLVADRLERRLGYLRPIMPRLGWPSWNASREEARKLLEQTPLP